MESPSASLKAGEEGKGNKLVGSFRMNPKDRKGTDEIIHCPMVARWSGRASRSVAQFGQGDYRHSYDFWANSSQVIADRGIAAQPEDTGVGVQQELHSAGGSLLE